MEQLNSLIINNLQRVFQVKIEVINNMKKQHFLKQYFYSFITLLTVLILSLAKTENLNSNNLFNIPHLDKLVHLSMYFGLTTIILIENKKKHKLIITLSTVILSGLIELIQQYLTNYRSGDWLDLLSNSIGSFTALLIIKLYYNRLIEIKLLKQILKAKYIIIR